MGNITAPSAEQVAHLVAKQIVPKGQTAKVAELADALAEIELQTQIAGASFIKVHLIDPHLAILRSGLITAEAGLLNEVEIEFPEGSGWEWVLCALEISTDFTQPNLVLTLEDKIVAELRNRRGAKTAPAGTGVPQFIHSLVAEVKPPIRFVCPALGQKLSARDVLGGKPATKEAEQHAVASANKNPAATTSDGLTVKGSPASAQQVMEANTLLAVANKLNAGARATEALLFAGIAESSLGGQSGAFTPNGAGYYGVLQGNSHEWPDPHDTQGMAEAFLKGGRGFQSGGAIALSRSVSDPVEIAVRVEAPSIWPDNAYASESGYEHFLPEARAFITQGGGASLEGSPTAQSSAGQLQRGTTQNPSEGSWECGTRLAKEKNWSLFSNGNTMFFIDGPQMIHQKPSLYIDITNNVITRFDEHGKKIVERDVIQTPATGTIDNTTLEYQATHKTHGKVQRRSKISKPSTPAELRLSLVCEIKAFRAGEVAVVQNTGPLNGRWIIADATRNCLKDTFTQLILQPPTEPITTNTQPGGTTPGGASGGAAAMAEKALADQQKSHPYRYVYGGGHEGAKLFSGPREFDCSSFASACYAEAGLKVPGRSGSGYPGTQEMIEACEKVSDPQAGDLCFFGTLDHTTHVTIYVGSGEAISMGQEGDPDRGPAKTTGPSGFLGYYRPKA